MTDVIRFQTNIPVEIALKYDPPGKEVEGRFGPQVLFTTTDDKVLYLHPAVASKIDALNIARGELFSICKCETKNGQKRGISYEVKRVDPAGDPSAVLNGLDGSAQVVPEIPIATAAAPKLVPINGHAAAQAEQADAVKLVQATQLASALKTAVAAAAMAEEFAKSLNYSVRFDGGHIYAMACTVLIGMQRTNGNGGH